MPHYLLQIAYSSESWAAQVNDPQNRVDRVRPAIEKLGGKLNAAYYSFGDYDIIALLEFPDNTSAAALSLAASAGGAVRSAKMTPLMTMEEGVEAMAKAAGSGYRAPGK